jgi:hypothetical protein
LLHVGYPKNASEWLQRHIFDDPAKGFVCRWNAFSGEPVEEFLLKNTARFDPREVRAKFERAYTGCGDLARVLSHVTLCGDPLCPRYDTPDWFALADRLHATFPDAGVLIIFREQRAMALSMYREYVRLGGQWPIEAFIGTGQERVGFAPFMRPDYLEYDILLTRYVELFGKQQVLALPFELLQQDGVQFEQRIHDFCQTGVVAQKFIPPWHVSLKGAASAVQRQLNKICPPVPGHYAGGRLNRRIKRAAFFCCRVVNKLTPGWAHRYFDNRLKRATDARVGHYYRESNQRLAALTGFDLKNLGYDLA